VIFPNRRIVATSSLEGDETAQRNLFDLVDDTHAAAGFLRMRQW
jgi:hypothetical protein